MEQQPLADQNSRKSDADAGDVVEKERDLTQLNERERAMLTIEKGRWKYPGAKEQRIKTELGLGAIAYYQQLNRLIDDPRAIAAEPALTRRLCEHRDG